MHLHSSRDAEHRRAARYWRADVDGCPVATGEEQEIHSALRRVSLAVVEAGVRISQIGSMKA